MNKSRRNFIKSIAIAGAGLSVPVTINAEPVYVIRAIGMHDLITKYYEVTKTNFKKVMSDAGLYSESLHRAFLEQPDIFKRA